MKSWKLTVISLSLGFATVDVSSPQCKSKRKAESRRGLAFFMLEAIAL